MNEQEILKEEVIKSKTLKLSADRALPQSSAEKLVKIIKAFAVASNGGETQVNYKDVASVITFHPTDVSRNNNFLVESQFLISPKYGYYVPTEGAVRFARESAWDEKGAKIHLRKIVAGCWYGQVAIQNFTLRSSLSKDELRKSLAIKCGASEGDSKSLDFLIDFILYTGLIETDENDLLIRGNLDEVWQELPSASPQNSVSQPTTTLAETVLANIKQMKDNIPETGEISLIIHFHVNNFEELTPDNASRLKQWLKSLKEMGDAIDVHVEHEESPSEIN